MSLVLEDSLRRGQGQGTGGQADRGLTLYLKRGSIVASLHYTAEKDRNIGDIALVEN